MGETAEMILDGILCQLCGAIMPDMLDDSTPDAPGHPRYCEDCEKEIGQDDNS